MGRHQGIIKKSSRRTTGIFQSLWNEFKIVSFVKRLYSKSTALRYIDVCNIYLYREFDRMFDWGWGRSKPFRPWWGICRPSSSSSVGRYIFWSVSKATLLAEQTLQDTKKEKKGKNPSLQPPLHTPSLFLLLLLLLLIRFYEIAVVDRLFKRPSSIGSNVIRADHIYCWIKSRT